MDLQINLLSEHEVTHLVRMLEAVSKKLGISKMDAVEELKREVPPRTLLSEIENAEKSERGHEKPYAR